MTCNLLFGSEKIVIYHEISSVWQKALNHFEAGPVCDVLLPLLTKPSLCSFFLGANNSRARQTHTRMKEAFSWTKRKVDLLFLTSV